MGLILCRSLLLCLFIYQIVRDLGPATMFCESLDRQICPADNLFCDSVGHALGIGVAWFAEIRTYLRKVVLDIDVPKKEPA